MFALSCNFQLLLSVSISPPTIHVTNILHNNAPILLRPKCSESAVVAADFHPERPSVFLLAFADGTCATYDAVQLARDGAKGVHRPGLTTSGIETMYIKNVHAISNTVSASAFEHGTEAHGFNCDTSVAGIGNKVLGITAIAFVPGYKLRFVTVGADGKCCVIDLAEPGKKKGQVVESWHVRGPATSLSVTSFHRVTGVFGHSDGQVRTGATAPFKGEVLIAIGRQDGHVLLFDLRGNHLGEERFPPDGSRVVDVEWMNSEEGVGVKRSRSGRTIAQSSAPSKPRRKSVGSVLARGRMETEEVISVVDGTDEPTRIPIRESSISETTAERATTHQRFFPATALNHLDLFSPIKSLSEKMATGKRLSQKLELASELSEATIRAKKRTQEFPVVDELSDNNRGKQSCKMSPPSPTPLRTALQKGDSHSAYGAVAAPSIEASSSATRTQRSGRRMATRTSTPSKGLALFAPYMKPNIIAIPSSTTDPKSQASSIEHTPSNPTPLDILDEGLWTDIGPPPPQNLTGPTPRRRTPAFRPRNHRKKAMSFRAFSSGPSEASNDTVIDWAAAASRPAFQNSLSPHPLLDVSPPKEARKDPAKGHVSLSHSFTSEDQVVQWSSFKKPPLINTGGDFLAVAPTHTLASTTHPSPLQGTSHNLKLPPSTTTVHTLFSSTCTSCAQLRAEIAREVRAAVHSEVQALRDDMTAGFGRQKAAIEALRLELIEVSRRATEEDEGRDR